MPWNGSGSYILDPSYYPEVNGTVIDAVRYNALLLDVQTGVTKALAKDGQNAATANIPFGGFKATGLGAASTAGDAVRYEQAFIVGETNLASAATCNIFTQGVATIQLTGTTTITSFGSGTAGQIIFCCTTSALTITYNAATMVTPGLQDLVLAAGDWFVVRSRGSSNAEITQVTRRASLATKLSDIGAATAANTLANGNNQQTWGWVFTATGQKGLYLTGQSNGAGTYGTILHVAHTTNGSGVEYVCRFSYTNSTSTYDSFYIDKDGAITVGGTNTPSGTGAAINITGVHSSTNSAGVGGALNIIGSDGGSASGTGGLMTFKPGGGNTKGTMLFSNNTGSFAFRFNNSSPAVTAGGGTGNSIRGTDYCFEVTFGTGSPTSVTVQFGTARGAAPPCIATGTQAGQVLTYSTTTTDVTISSGTAFSNGTKVTCWVPHLS